jgi:hypothetical protein
MNLVGPLVWNFVPTNHKESPTSTGPKDVGSALPDPLGVGLAVSDPSERGSAPFDPRSVGSVPPDPLDRFWVGLRQQHGPLRGPPPPPTATHAGCGPKTMPLTLGRGWAHLDVTDGRHKLYLGTHVPNSVRRTGTMLLDPRATLDRGSVDHTACQEGMEHHAQVTAPAYRTSGGRGIMTKDGDAHL